MGTGVEGAKRDMGIGGEGQGQRGKRAQVWREEQRERCGQGMCWLGCVCTTGPRGNQPAGDVLDSLPVVGWTACRGCAGQPASDGLDSLSRMGWIAEETKQLSEQQETIKPATSKIKNNKKSTTT
eukprot:299373-Chlamydomonas_euryale.AAC.1